MTLKGFRTALFGLGTVAMLLDCATSRGPDQPPPGEQRGAVEVPAGQDDLTAANLADPQQAPEPQRSDSSTLQSDSIRSAVSPGKGDSLLLTERDSTGEKVKTPEKKTQVPPKKAYNPAPLICEANPGTMKGSGSRNEYILEGEVVCYYEQLVFNTQKAIWNSRNNTVKFFGGMKVVTNGLILTSERGGYEKAKGQIWARQNAKVVDTSETYAFSGEYLSYDTDGRQMLLKNKAHLQKLFRDTVYFKEKSRASKIHKIKTDTLHIRAKQIDYNDSLNFAEATGSVRIDRGKLNIRCQKAWYSEDSEIIDFLGDPLAAYHHNIMQGDTMKLQLRGEAFESMSFKGNAHGKFFENEDSLTATELYLIKGDSLFLKMEKDELSFIESLRNGSATYILRKYPEQENTMEGRYLKLDFAEGKIDSASIFGAATSTYFIYDEDDFKGKNEARGDSIALTFSQGKVADIFIRGTAQGTFFGEEENSLAQRDTTSRDSLKIPTPNP